MQATRIIEALLFASDAPLAAEDLARGDEALDVAGVETAVDQLRRAYDQEERAFQIYEIAGGYQILTRPEFAPYLERFETVTQPSRLSGPALEVLAIVAYRQPIGRAEIEHIRGVGSAAVLRTLQERDLIEVVGRAEGLGRPLLYGITARFLDHFGFRSLQDLPRPEDLPVVLHDREATGQSLDSGGEAAGQSLESGPEAAGQSMEADGETRSAEGQSLEGGPEATGQSMDTEGETGGQGEAGKAGPANGEDRPGGADLQRAGPASAGDTADDAESADALSPSPRPPVSPSGGGEEGGRPVSPSGGGEEGGPPVAPSGGGTDEAAATRPDILDDLSDDLEEE